MTEPTMTLAEAQSAVAAKTAPKVTAASIGEKIESVDYLTHGLLTIAVVTMRSGFKVIGKAAAASPENHDPAVSERYAYEDAFRQLWPLEGYLLRERLAGGEG